MNNQRRKDLRSAIDKLYASVSILEDVHSDEESAYDSMPESIQGSERGERMQEIIDVLSDKISELNDTITELEECLE